MILLKYLRRTTNSIQSGNEATNKHECTLILETRENTEAAKKRMSNRGYTPINADFNYLSSPLMGEDQGEGEPSVPIRFNLRFNFSTVSWLN